MKNKLIIGVISVGLIITGVSVTSADSNKESDIFLDTNTGEVLSIDKELNDEDMEDPEMEKAIAVKLISELQAIDIAESIVEGTVVAMELDEDDGLYVYELELKTSNGKAEVDVNAHTGDVLKKEVNLISKP